MKYGIVVYTGCSSQEMLDEKKAPEGAEGPYVISGNHRSFFFLVDVSFRVSVAREILDELPANSRDRQFYEEFMMSIYCFPNPKAPRQLTMIRGLAFVENVIRDLKVEVASHEVLANVRREGFRVQQLFPKLSGKFSFFVAFEDH